jgi:hypothetical protein
MNNEKFNIEVLDSGNNWLRVETGHLYSPQHVARTLKYTKQRYPNNRIRAVTHESGRLLDMLM